jgi:hypothetical protein
MTQLSPTSRSATELYVIRTSFDSIGRRRIDDALRLLLYFYESSGKHADELGRASRPDGSLTDFYLIVCPNDETSIRH